MNATAIVPVLLGAWTLLGAARATGATTVTVTGVNFLKVRSGPSFEAAETTALAAGATVELVEEVGMWASIVLPDGTRGYASRKYLSPTTAAAPAQPAASDAAAPPSSARPGTTHTDERAAVEHDNGDAADERPVTGAAGAEAAADPDVAAGRAAPAVEQTVVPARTLLVAATEAAPGPACTKADLDALRSEVRALAGRCAAGGGAASAADPRPEQDAPGRMLPDRSQLLWLASGCILGWLFGRFAGSRDRWRRNRIRI